jgi:hypothetical protein
VHHCATPRGVALELDEVGIQVRDHPVAKRGAVGSQFLPGPELGDGLCSPVDKLAFRLLHVRLQQGVLELLGGTPLEVHGLDLHQPSPPAISSAK